AHVMSSDADARPPHELTPAFYGCYDWHSSVHGHWMLARVAHLYPGQPIAVRARAALAKSITAENIAQETAYFSSGGRATFEWPYGLAWLLALALELREMKSPLAPVIAPLEQAVVARLLAWLPKLSHPVRSGEHSQTAFALGLALDYADAANPSFASLIRDRARAFYLNDRACPANYEPSGEDFLSPCLAEADLMRRVLLPGEYSKWLDRFLPLMTCAPLVVTDPTDGKLAHLDGLNLSRAWMLTGIASALQPVHRRRAAILRLAEAHGKTGLAAVTGEHYEGGHWLGSFAIYYATGRGLK
ncbi:MAG TPA: DUF2891 domain-containing protein, partial [Bryobacteraceae bacterium]|nr:DUF2891 domain-containing protein [Bryobacteraceae bacterium]